MLTLTKQQVAYMAGVDERTITRWQRRSEDPLPVRHAGRRGHPNAYDALDVQRWLTRQELAKLTVGEDGELIDYDRERARLTREQADNTALKNAQLRKELAPVGVMEWALGKIGAQISAILETIPLKVKRRVPRLAAAEVEIIKREVVKAQNMAARVTVDLDECLTDVAKDSGAQEGG